MILCDQSIRERIKNGQIFIDPYTEEFLQPASYDLRMDKNFMIFDRTQHESIDVRRPVKNLMQQVTIVEDEPFILHPGTFALANTLEVVGVDNQHVGWLEGKSSLGRLGLVIHATAGFLDPGNKLRMTLELSNLGSLPIKLYYKMKIAQIAFGQLDQPCQRPYGSKELKSKYFGDMSVKASLMHENFHK
ncbi:dCTP deaminase [Patescibacteria group bacterium]|nr:dCTP deaminase [Patescibacteria group bacterium]